MFSSIIKSESNAPSPLRELHWLSQLSFSLVNCNLTLFIMTISEGNLIAKVFHYFQHYFFPQTFNK